MIAVKLAPPKPPPVAKRQGGVPQIVRQVTQVIETHEPGISCRRRQVSNFSRNLDRPGNTSHARRRNAFRRLGPSPGCEREPVAIYLPRTSLCHRDANKGRGRTLRVTLIADGLKAPEPVAEISSRVLHNPRTDQGSCIRARAVPCYLASPIAPQARRRRSASVPLRLPLSCGS